MFRRALLMCGVVSSLLYVAMNVVVAMQWDGYSSASQTVSELSAIGAPTRRLWVVLGTFYSLLVIAFGWGIWRSDDRKSPVRAIGGLLIAYGAVSLFWPFTPMHLRGFEATMTDTMHIVLAMITVVLMVGAIGIGASVFGKRFRAYSWATLATLVVCGALTAVEAPRIAANLPTPRIGIWERINIGAFLVWVIVLAIGLLRRSNDVPRLKKIAPMI